jgi:hypothetical protein
MYDRGPHIQNLLAVSRGAATAASALAVRLPTVLQHLELK